jgi:predicted DNA-binding transcriptional regulator YafY
MERSERLLALHRLLKSTRSPVSVNAMMKALGCARATVHRDLEFLRDKQGEPIVAVGRGWYRYDETAGARQEVGGPWLSSDELHALLATHQLLKRTSGGELSGALGPLRERIDGLLAEQTGANNWPAERVRVIASGQRNLDQATFRMTAAAVLERKQLAFDYRARSTDERSHRKVSPQRLTHYRDNWYLDAWDFDREAMRSFAIDRISAPRVLEAVANDLPDGALDAHFADGYGIFSGPSRAWATIVFSAKAARWAADAHWHAKQVGQFLADGRYRLRLPYGSAKELLMDVLRYGADAEITEPVSLRQQARAILQLALGAYDE